MRQHGYLSLFLISFFTFLTITAFCTCVSGSTLKFPDAKSRAVYNKINAKIAKLQTNRKIKIKRVKAKHYSAATEKAKIDRINFKYNRAIQRYKDKGNRYFSRRGLPQPWVRKTRHRTKAHASHSPKAVKTAASHKTKTLPAHAAASVKNTPSASLSPHSDTASTTAVSGKTQTAAALTSVSATDQKPQNLQENTLIQKNTQQPSGPSLESPASPAKNTGQQQAIPAGAASMQAATPAPHLSAHEPLPRQDTAHSSDNRQKSRTGASQIIPPGNKVTEKGIPNIESSSDNKWAIAAAASGGIMLLMGFILYKKRASVRTVLVCGIFLCAAAASVFLAVSYFTNPSPSPVTTAQKSLKADTKRLNNYYTQNAATWHDLGARLFARAVVENDRGKLFKAIYYLEKAYTAGPDSRGMTVDLADAYMEADSPRLTAMAIDLYESVFDSFNDDQLVARLAAAYQQLHNFDAAFAFTEQRLKHCPDDKRTEAAIQLGFSAMLAGRQNEAIQAIKQDMKRRGNNSALALVMASLYQGKGDRETALETIDTVLADNSASQKLRSYAEHMKEEI